MSEILPQFDLFRFRLRWNFSSFLDCYLNWLIAKVSDTFWDLHRHHHFKWQKCAIAMALASTMACRTKSANCYIWIFLKSLGSNWAQSTFLTFVHSLQQLSIFHLSIWIQLCLSCQRTVQLTWLQVLTRLSKQYQSHYGNFLQLLIILPPVQDRSRLPSFTDSTSPSRPTGTVQMSVFFAKTNKLLPSNNLMDFSNVLMLSHTLHCHKRT